uniref:Uncharacterized protein n=1 Tax=Medicago truncatula TaxID=3880 RepID=I3T369_MEDTR|nr:unknown [Medicago truncatula]
MPLRSFCSYKNIIRKWDDF